MHVRVSTKIKRNYKEVFSDFELPLFKALQPRGLQMEIVKFTGSRKGDTVHIKFISPIKGEWISIITDDGLNEEEAYFIDEGTLMPFKIIKWKHCHLISNINHTYCLITDDIYFETKNPLRSYVYFLVVWIGMLKRKKIYRSYFNQ